MATEAKGVVEIIRGMMADFMCPLDRAEGWLGSW